MVAELRQIECQTPLVGFDSKSLLRKEITALSENLPANYSPQYSNISSFTSKVKFKSQKIDFILVQIKLKQLKWFSFHVNAQYISLI